MLLANLLAKYLSLVKEKPTQIQLEKPRYP